MTCPYCSGLGWLIQYTLAGFRDVDEEWEPCRCNPNRLAPVEFKKK